MMLDALNQISDWKPIEIEKYLGSLMSPMINEFEKIGLLVDEKEYLCNHMVGIVFPKNIDLNQLYSELEAKKIYCSLRGNALRISPYVYNNPDDINVLVEFIKKFMLNKKI
jgi:selenocysteine lyase/cysteine desulfurase